MAVTDCPLTAAPAPRVISEGFAGRHAWVHVARGQVTVNGKTLGEGDGAALTDERAVEIAGGDGEVLVFDLA